MPKPQQFYGEILEFFTVQSIPAINKRLAFPGHPWVVAFQQDEALAGKVLDIIYQRLRDAENAPIKQGSTERIRAWNRLITHIQTLTAPNQYDRGL